VHVESLLSSNLCNKKKPDPASISPRIIIRRDPYISINLPKTCEPNALVSTSGTCMKLVSEVLISLLSFHVFILE
jgi:hypothetical protein